MKVNTKGLAATWFAPKNRNSEEPRAEFKLEPLPSIVIMEVEDHVQKVDSGHTISAYGRKVLLMRGVSDWRNIEDEEGQPLKFSYENLMKLHPFILNELAVEIWNQSTFPEEERKN